MIDEDLANLYGVETKRLDPASQTRTSKRFPEDFMFQLSKAEAEALKSQIATSNKSRGGRRYAPYVFTEHGVAMLSGVVRSDRAIAVKYRDHACIRRVLRRVAGSVQALLKTDLIRWNWISARDSASTMSSFARSSRPCDQLIAPPPRATPRWLQSSQDDE